VSDRIHYTQCPSCYSEQISEKLKARDHTVSHEVFTVWHCDDCSLRFTQDIPGQQSIGSYYKSQDYISHSDTSKGLLNRLYRMVRHITLKNKRSLICSYTHLSKGSLLDVGSGTGAFAAYMQRAEWTVTALEPDETARKKSSELWSLQAEDPSKLYEMEAGQYDAVTLWHVIEHVHTIHQYLEQLKKILKPGGTLFIAVPNYTSYDAGLYKEFWAAYDVPRHLYHFSPAAMRTLLQQHGLQLKDTRPMWFDSFYVGMLSEKYKSGHSGVIKGFWNGAISNLKALSDKETASSLIYIITK
jgi:SAM-dependent methyltransferase